MDTRKFLGPPFVSLGFVFWVHSASIPAHGGLRELLKGACIKALSFLKTDADSPLGAYRSPQSESIDSNLSWKEKRQLKAQIKNATPTILKSHKLSPEKAHERMLGLGMSRPEEAAKLLEFLEQPFFFKPAFTEQQVGGNSAPPYLQVRNNAALALAALMQASGKLNERDQHRVFERLVFLTRHSSGMQPYYQKILTMGLVDMAAQDPSRIPHVFSTFANHKLEDWVEGEWDWDINSRELIALTNRAISLAPSEKPASKDVARVYSQLIEFMLENAQTAKAKQKALALGQGNSLVLAAIEYFKALGPEGATQRSLFESQLARLSALASR